MFCQIQMIEDGTRVEIWPWSLGPTLETTVCTISMHEVPKSPTKVEPPSLCAISEDKASWTDDHI